MAITNHKTAFVLAGGGSLGAIQGGMLAELMNAGYIYSRMRRTLILCGARVWACGMRIPLGSIKGMRHR